MEIEINKEQVWGKFRQDRNGVVVRFFYPKFTNKIYIEETSPNMKGKVFRWLPTYKQLEDIKKALEEVEKLNKELNIKKEVGENPYNKEEEKKMDMEKYLFSIKEKEAQENITNYCARIRAKDFAKEIHRYLEDK